MAQTRRVELALPIGQAHQRVLQAFAACGKLEESSATTYTARGLVKYALAPVKMRVSVLSTAAGGSVVELTARGSDVWGYGARKGLDRFVSALG